MAEGGFLIKLDRKEVARCYTVAFDYDEWQYVINDTEKHELSTELESVTIELERQ